MVSTPQKLGRAASHNPLKESPPRVRVLQVTTSSGDETPPGTHRDLQGSSQPRNSYHTPSLKTGACGLGIMSFREKRR